MIPVGNQFSKVNCDRSTLETIERFSASAWPALSEVDFDGWRLRFSNGFGRRVNSISPLEVGILSPADKIAACENMYRKRGLDTLFKLTPLCESPNLDSTLAHAGYNAEGQVSVQIAHLGTVEVSPECRCVSCGADEWVNALGRVSVMAPERLAEFRRIAHSIRPLVQFCWIDRGCEPAAVGMAVLEDTWVGLFNIEVAANWRRAGLGRAIMLELLNWGRKQGAAGAYLFVTQENDPAQALYRQLGFTHLYPYWFRRKRLSAEYREPSRLGDPGE